MRHRTWRGISCSLHPAGSWQGAPGSELDAVHPQRAGLLLGATAGGGCDHRGFSSLPILKGNASRDQGLPALSGHDGLVSTSAAAPRDGSRALWEVRGSRLRQEQPGSRAMTREHAPASAPPRSPAWLVFLGSVSSLTGGLGQTLLHYLGQVTHA